MRTETVKIVNVVSELTNESRLYLHEIYGVGNDSCVWWTTDSDLDEEYDLEAIKLNKELVALGVAENGEKVLMDICW